MSESGEEGRFRLVQKPSFSPKTSWNSNSVIKRSLVQIQARRCWDTEDLSDTATILWPPMLVSQLPKQAWHIQVRDSTWRCAGALWQGGASTAPTPQWTRPASLRKVVSSHLLFSREPQEQKGAELSTWAGFRQWIDVLAVCSVCVNTSNPRS